MKKTKTNLDDFIVTPEDVKTTGQTYSDYYVNHLKTNPKALEDYKKFVVRDYKKTKDASMFLKRFKTITKNGIDFEITPEDVKTTGEDFQDYYANYLKENPKKLKNYKKFIVEEYNKTKDAVIFLESLKTVAKAENKKTKIAKKANIKKANYRSLSKDGNPNFNNIIAIANNVGIDFIACYVR
ncbi:MAG: hypothetical protein LBT79_00085 [Elusimicrobiota bacterium]|jgi:DNA-binding phage protein|nr:hypothetical protein [Elusimicrobiota bacterium]